MKIKIVAVEVGQGTTKSNKPYDFLEVTYKNLTFEGKTESKKVMPFGAKEVFDALKKSKSGETYTLLREKDNAGYWQWIGIVEGDTNIETENTTKTDGYAAAAPSKAVPAKSTFETPEERAKKQVYIIRQSSISAAIDTLKTDKKAPTKEEVVGLATYYTDFVLGNDVKVAATAKVTPPPFDPDEDIPL